MRPMLWKRLSFAGLARPFGTPWSLADWPTGSGLRIAARPQSPGLPNEIERHTAGNVQRAAVGLSVRDDVADGAIHGDRRVQCDGQATRDVRLTARQPQRGRQYVRFRRVRLADAAHDPR